MDRMSTPYSPTSREVKDPSKDVIRNIRTSKTWQGRVFVEHDTGSSYVDPKSADTLNFLGKERVRFPITDEYPSLAVFTKKFAELAGIKAEAEKRGLGSCVELKFCCLEKGKDGSKAFAINTQEQWDEERPLLSGNTSSL